MISRRWRRVESKSTLISGVVGVACGAEHCNAIWGLLSLQALKSHFLPFIGQEGPKLEIYYDTIRLHI